VELMRKRIAALLEEREGELTPTAKRKERDRA
jgi:hypothetical protein